MNIKKIAKELLLEKKYKGEEICFEISHLIDNFIIEEVNRDYQKLDQKFSILSLGGYGREEITPNSDIDLEILYKGRLTKEFESFSRELANKAEETSMKVSIALRDEEETLHLLRNDFKTYFSFLDARFLCGDKKFGGHFFEKVKKIFIRKSSSFFHSLIYEINRRKDKFHSSHYILEPDIKLSPGGLRDISSILWIGKLFFDSQSLRELYEKWIIKKDDYENIISARSFILKLRLILSSILDQRNDKLSFESQGNIYNLMNEKTPEDLMRKYYFYAYSVEFVLQMLIKKIISGKNLSKRKYKIDDNNYFINGYLKNIDSEFGKNPEEIFRTFTIAAENNYTIHPDTEEFAKTHLYLFKNILSSSKNARKDFFTILTTPSDNGKSLWRMLDLGILENIISEFKNIRFLTKRDFYHLYTVDVHTLKAIEFVKRILGGMAKKKFPLATKVIEELNDVTPLFLAILLHDIGKGGTDVNHTLKSSEIAGKILNDFNFSKEKVNKIIFLIKNHLLMSEMIQRRDSEDLRVITGFAREMKEIETLNELFLLTLADLSSVSPTMLTDWKVTLLEKLYLKTRNVLEKGLDVYADPEDIVRNRKMEVFKILRLQSFKEQEIEDFFGGFSTKYFSVYNSDEILNHIKLLKEAHREGISVLIEETELKGHFNITIAGLDSPGLLWRITGVLFSSGNTILKARIWTRIDGQILDTFSVRDISGYSLLDERARRKMVEKIKLVHKDMDIISKAEIRLSDTKKILTIKKFKFEPEVLINNEISSESTVISIKTLDRAGLLHTIAEKIFKMGLSINTAIIDTEGDFAVDSFYVEYIGGGKITDDKKIKEIIDEMSKI